MIDCWQQLEHPLEKQVKKDIIDFLEDNNDAYIINGCYDTDRFDCDASLLEYLEKNKSRHLNIDITDSEWSLKLPWDHYTVCGFHSLHCLLRRPVGLLNCMRIHTKRHRDMTVRFDLSCNDDDGVYEYITWPHWKIKERVLLYRNSPIKIMTKSR